MRGRGGWRREGYNELDGIVINRRERGEKEGWCLCVCVCDGEKCSKLFGRVSVFLKF